ncbi:MAG TPA: ribosomal protein S18-alanine N-acetyltransferase [Hyphomicrobiaceae bacterium]|nr:ribosomal protein S18-alanine N-acetyltransferase [Hyphomicrobiaceae bacterium]
MNSGLTGVRIDAALPENAGEIAALHARLFAEPWNAQSIVRLIEHPAAMTTLARGEVAGALVGFLMAQAAADEVEILSIGVAPEWQRRGIARRLIEDLMTRTAERGARYLHVEVAADNDAAIALYVALGFQPNGRRNGYYVRGNAPPADALLLVKPL